MTKPSQEFVSHAGDREKLRDDARAEFLSALAELYPACLQELAHHQTFGYDTYDEALAFARKWKRRWRLEESYWSDPWIERSVVRAILNSTRELTLARGGPTIAKTRELCRPWSSANLGMDLLLVDAFDNQQIPVRLNDLFPVWPDDGEDFDSLAELPVWMIRSTNALNPVLDTWQYGTEPVAAIVDRMTAVYEKRIRALLEPIANGRVEFFGDMIVGNQAAGKKEVRKHCLFLAMELVEQTTIAALAEKGPLGLRYENPADLNAVLISIAEIIQVQRP